VEPAATAAKDRISAALTRDSDNLALIILQARVFFEQKEIDQVLALLTNVKTAPEQRPNMYWQMLINSYKAKRQNKNALESALLWRNSQPQNLAAQINYIAALIENRQFEEALKLTQLQLKMHPNVPELKNMAAVLQAETKDYAGAITSLNLLPKETQQKPEIMLLKGKLLMSQGKYMEAKTALLASYQQNKSAQTAMYIADMVAKNETPEAAVRFIENHFSTEPKHPLLQSMYANLLLAVDPNKASTTYTSLINEDPENFMALNNLAYLYSEQGKPKEALQYVEKALKLEPNHPDALDTMGRVMLLQGNIDDALKYFEQSLKIRPEHPDVSLNYAEALILQGNKEKAKSILSNIQVNDPMLLKKSKRISELL
jgi:predicted Zn-dependent protease